MIASAASHVCHFSLDFFGGCYALPGTELGPPPVAVWFPVGKALWAVLAILLVIVLLLPAVLPAPLVKDTAE